MKVRQKPTQHIAYKAPAQSANVYVVLRRSGRMKLEDAVVELKQWDAVRVPRHVAGLRGGAETIWSGTNVEDLRLP